ncbi:MAG: ABC transporter permease [Anaerolineae bacterium]|nr:ABC transporter permease [Anaerolineae bacterium]
MITSFFENLRISLGEIRTNKLRSFLTVLGITIGIAAVVLLMSLGQSVQAYITGQFESLGASTIRVSAERDSNGRLDELTEELAVKLNDPERLPSVKLAMPETNSNYSITYENNQFTVAVTGATTDYLTAESRTMDQGRMFDADEYAQSVQVAVIGVTTAENLFGSADIAIGKTIRIDTVLFNVIGVLKKKGTGDDTIVIPMTAFKARLRNRYTASGGSVVNTILVQATNSESVTAATDELKIALRQERGVKTGATDNFRVFTASTIVSSLTSVIQILTIFLGVVAGISLLVGGINIMNIMLVAITERTREIGLRKAVGAQDSDIVVLFLFQAVVLTLIGGAAGIVVAWLGAALIGSLIANFTVVIQLVNIVFAVSISTMIGIFFGVYPAFRAARLNPIQALRYE